MWLTCSIIHLHARANIILISPCDRGVWAVPRHPALPEYRVAPWPSPASPWEGRPWSQTTAGHWCPWPEQGETDVYYWYESWIRVDTNNTICLRLVIYWQPLGGLTMAVFLADKTHRLDLKPVIVICSCPGDICTWELPNRCINLKTRLGSSHKGQSNQVIKFNSGFVGS